MAVTTKDTTTKVPCKYKHLSTFERGQMFILKKEGYSIRTIASRLRRSASTISREFKRGTVQQVDTYLKPFKAYFPEAGQAIYKKNRSHCGAKSRLAEVEEFLAHVEKNIRENKWSPDIIVGSCHLDPKWRDKPMVCTKTLYNYIGAGLMNIRNIDLALKVRRKPKNKKSHLHKRLIGLSIDERPSEIEQRKELGHWEIDTVIGKKGDGKVLLTLTERQTRHELIRLIDGKKPEAVNQAIQEIRESFGSHFEKCFRSLTADNGTEFSWLPNILPQDKCPVYFAHPYSSWERGTNERHNGLIRRWIPKGKSLNALSPETVRRIEDWCNSLPRKILGYRTPHQCFLHELEKVS